MIYIRFFFLVFFFTGCATRPESLRSEFSTKQNVKILDIPFVAQTDYHCGPASLAMVSAHLGKHTDVTTLSDMLYTPGSKGTYQNDLVATVRRLGLIAVPVVEMKQMFQEINDGHPVLIFQNLGLSWLPKWHYAVVVGYNLDDNVMVLHSGAIKNFELKISTFKSIWKRVDNWGLLIVNPGDIPKTASELDMVEATAGLEMAGQLQSAKISYEKILEKWPFSLGTLTGLGNIQFQLKDFLKSSAYLKKATDLYPKAAGAWHNYAIVLMALNNSDGAQFAAKKAVETAQDPATEKIYRENLKSLLN